jgi:hypothetical protein
MCSILWGLSRSILSVPCPFPAPDAYLNFNRYNAIRRVVDENPWRYYVGKSSCNKYLFRSLPCFQKVFNLLMLVCEEHARMVIPPNQHADFL